MCALYAAKGLYSSQYFQSEVYTVIGLNMQEYIRSCRTLYVILGSVGHIFKKGKLIAISCQSFVSALNMCSDSESDYSASCSEEEEDDNNCEETADLDVLQKTPAGPPATSASGSKEVPAKKLKKNTSVSLNAVQLVNNISC